MKIIKIPSELGGMNKSKGTSKAPDEIIKASYDFYLSEDGKHSDYDIEEIEVNPSNLEETNENIYSKIKQLNQHAILLGGDHSITYPAFRAFISNNPDTGLIIFDAHPDCENNFHPPTHEDFVKTLVEDGILNPKNIILVGIRNWHIKEYEFLIKHNIKFYTMKEIFEKGTRDICDSIMFVAKEWPSLYLSIDIDVVDPSFAPGTGYREPGGLTSRELLYFIQRLKFLKNLKIADIVEINPNIDVNALTVNLGAKILKELSD